MDFKSNNKQMYTNKKPAPKHIGPNPPLVQAVQFWEKEQPQFIERTLTQYARAPIKVLFDRGIANRLLDSLIEGLPKGAYIAGGFLTSVVQEDDKASDIDLFFNSEEAFLATYKLFSEGPVEPPDQLEQFDGNEDNSSKLWAFRGWRICDETAPGQDGSKQRFVKFEHDTLPPVQLIKLVWYKDAEHVIDSFDLTIAQLATDGRELVFNPLSFLDIVRKRIVLHRMQFPASTIRRVIKYTSKGYYACAGALENIALQIHEAIKNNPGDIAKVVYVD